MKRKMFLLNAIESIISKKGFDLQEDPVLEEGNE
jgi:hypothetical protein